MMVSLLRRHEPARASTKIFWKMGERAHYRIRREPAKRTKRAELHGVAEVFDQRDVRLGIVAVDDAIERLHTARRANAAGRALTARFQRTEFHGEARLFRHVDVVIKHDDAAMPDQAIARHEGFVIERRVEKRAREISPQRTAD